MYRIEQINSSDQEKMLDYVNQIADIHKLSYADFHFSSLLNNDLMIEYNYNLVRDSEITLLAVQDGVVLGYLISGYDFSAGISEFVKKHKIYLIIKLLLHPLFLFRRVMVILRQHFGNSTESAAKYRLLSLATRPEAQSKGVGRELCLSLESALKQRSIGSYGLSVNRENVRATNFYLRLGFQKENSTSSIIYLVKNV